MSQLWELGKKSQGRATGGAINQALTRFPALALAWFYRGTHGRWSCRLGTVFTVLKRFLAGRYPGIQWTRFLLLPEHVFRANVNALLAIM